MNKTYAQGFKQFKTGIALFLLIWLAGLIPLDQIFRSFLSPYNAEILRDTVIQLSGTLVILVIACKSGFQKNMGLSKVRPSHSWFLIWPMLLLALVNIPEEFAPEKITFKLFLNPTPWIRLLFVISVGLVEEFLGRSLVGAGLMAMFHEKKAGLYKAALISSLIFALVHIGNFFVYNFSPLASLSQILMAFFLGIYFFALFARTGSVWPGIISHAVIDLCARLDIFSGTALLQPPSQMEFVQSPLSFLITLTITLPLGITGLFLLRKIVKQNGDT